MPNQRADPEIKLVDAPPESVDADLVAIPVFEEDDLADIDGLNAATGGEIQRARQAKEFRPKLGELFLTRVTGSNWRARRVVLIGGGSVGDHQPEQLRITAAVAAKAARQYRVERLAFVCRKGGDPTTACQAVAEGLILGSFDDRRFKTDDDGLVLLRECQVLMTTAEAHATTAGPALVRGKILAIATNFSRELTNEPGNVLTPSTFAERAAALVSTAGVAVDVLDESAIADLGMGLLLGVARGSAEPPRLVVMRHEPPDVRDQAVLGLVGKGVTFDSGGISIKPADGMDRMKEDMSGGGAVVCAMRAIGALAVPRRVIGVVPMTENMPGSRATKPGDILTSASGKTVEVVNTDAEGRLILADALWHAQRLGATHLVDVATLTGSCIVALGHAASGLFGRPTTWVEVVRRASQRAGERSWLLPLYEEYKEQLRSETADLVNSGGRPAGACTAAAFLEVFTGGRPWAHLDIAGTAWCEEARPGQVKGPTGIMVRTLAELALAPDSW